MDSARKTSSRKSKRTPMLMPSVTRTIQNGRRTRCSGGLRQVALIMSAYAHEHFAGRIQHENAVMVDAFLPVVEFECDYFHDFSHTIAKPRSILGYEPQYDIFRIIDDGIAFRKSGGKRHPLKYIG